MTTQLLAEMTGVILAAVFVGVIEARYFDGATNTPFYTIVDASDNRISGATVILPPWFHRMRSSSPTASGIWSKSRSSTGTATSTVWCRVVPTLTARRN